MKKLSYKDVFRSNEKIARDVIHNHLTEEQAGKKWGLTPQLVKTMVRQYKLNSHLKWSAKEENKTPEIKDPEIYEIIDTFESYREYMDEMRKYFIERKVAQEDGNVARVSVKNGIGRSQVYRLMKK